MATSVRDNLAISVDTLKYPAFSICYLPPLIGGLWVPPLSVMAISSLCPLVPPPHTPVCEPLGPVRDGHQLTLPAAFQPLDDGEHVRLVN